MHQQRPRALEHTLQLAADQHAEAVATLNASETPAWRALRKVLLDARQSQRQTAEQIKACRGSLKTKEIIIRLRSKLDSMLSEGHPPRGDLMDKALRYMKTFWKQLFAYTKDGSYTIDNSLAERFIRPLAGERKNSLFFGSDKMAGVSATYHTIISTCRMQGVSVLEYLRSFFREIVKGRRDYKNLLPMTIGINNNKL